MHEEKVTFNGCNGLLTKPDDFKASVILCHGLGGVKEAWGEWPARLASNGYQVLAFDFRGSGESSPSFEERNLSTQIEDLLHAIEFLKEKCFLIGASFGGTTAINTAAKSSKVKGLITLAGAWSLEEWAEGFFAREARQKGYVVFDTGNKYTREFFEDAAHNDTILSATKVKCPWLLLHGTEDDVINIDQGKRLFESANCEKNFIIVQGADHNFSSIYFEELVLKEVIAWLQKH